MHIDQKVTKDIKFETNDLEILKQHFPHCFDQHGNFQFEKFKDHLNQKQLPLSSEHYHLNWLGKSYARLLATDPTSTLLKADSKHNENMKSGNLLIKGDNLDVLKHLLHAYYEKVKMIYIDPPYNTGNDGFIYQDDRKFTVEQLIGMIGGDRGEAERILKFVSSGSNSHSAWLSFMYPRLYLARQLLREDGVIFVSIDDHEVAQLRLLMDEIFGEENFVSNIAWRKSDNQANIGQIARVKEYIFCYAKEKDVLNLSKIPLTEKAKKEYSYKDEIGNFRRGILLDKTRGRHFYDVKTKYGNLLKGPWMIKEDEFKKLDQENKVLWTSRGDEQPYKKIYLQESIGQIANDFWDTTFGSNQEASLALEHLLGQRVFDFPKSIKLIKNLLIINNDNDSIILDFFAGSGTTAHAVMQLNAEDGGNRKFILVQIPEPIDPKTNKSAYDFVKNDLNATPTIFEITKERLIRASKQIATTLKEKIQSKELNLSDLESQPDLYNSNQEKINQLKSEIQSLKSQDIHFKIFETVPIWPNYNDEIAEFSSDLKLFDETMLTSEDLQSLLITWKTYDGIPLTQELEEIKLNDYIAHYGNQKLYLIYKSFTIDHLTLLLNRIEDQKDFNPTTIILFAYHFESTILRSISEGIKTYNGRKQLQIDVINRY